MSTQSSTSNRYLSVKQTVDAGLYPSESGLRWLLFHSEKNGLSTAVVRVGRRVLLDEQASHAWMNNQREARA